MFIIVIILRYFTGFSKNIIFEIIFLSMFIDKFIKNKNFKILESNEIPKPNYD